jgi:hypothetical protein
MEKFNAIIAALILAATALVIFFILIPKVDRFLNIKAIEVCSGASRYTQNTDETSAQYPVSNLYEECLSQTR